ncbi:MAG: hypothetical protein F6K56_37035 [Moorea sp. SIO3G5]|nr:hypothetical protein [Moorena sp. SIO3G5]
MIRKAMQRLNERVSPTRALHQDNTLTRSLIKTTLAFRPRYANNLQPWPFGHATRTTFNIGLSATLREQPSTLAFRPRYANNLPTFNKDKLLLRNIDAYCSIY